MSAVTSSRVAAAIFVGSLVAKGSGLVKTAGILAK